MLDVVSIDLADGQLTAVCRLGQSQGLGTASVTKEVTYRFKLMAEDGNVYYQIETVSL